MHTKNLKYGFIELRLYKYLSESLRQGLIEMIEKNFHAQLIFERDTKIRRRIQFKIPNFNAGYFDMACEKLISRCQYQLIIPEFFEIDYFRRSILIDPLDLVLDVDSKLTRDDGADLVMANIFERALYDSRSWDEFDSLVFRDAGDYLTPSVIVRINPGAGVPYRLFSEDWRAEGAWFVLQCMLRIATLRDI